MAKAATTEAEAETKALVAQTGSTELSAELLEELGLDAGAGTSQSADDNIVPFIVLLQDMSPEAKKRDPAYVPGAEPGMLLNRATRQLYAYSEEHATETGFPLLHFQPCAFDRAVIEWVPRKDGGGFVARHEFKGTVEETMARIGGKQMEITTEDGDVRLAWRSGDGKHDLIDTRYHYGHIINADGSPSPAVIGFSSTGHTASREWMTMMNNFKIPVNGQLLAAPSWSKFYVVRSKTKSNNKGDFFVITVDDGGIIKDKALRDLGKSLNKAFDSGNLKADETTSENATTKDSSSTIDGSQI